ncbi:notchless protein like protein [Quercus suber]|uniref:Notchless protein like protein n=1 Tax=Quercus suber TaxID=58331 RepID=A0AAW0L3R1_QUESU
MEVVEGEEQRETSNKVMCLLTDPEGTPLGVPMYLPQIAGPQQLQQMVNQLLNNVTLKLYFQLPLVLMGDIWQVVLVIPQSEFGILIPRHHYSHVQGHKKWITGISWEPAHLNAPCRRFVSASKDGDARIWDIVTKKCVICLSGHTLAITCVKWGGDGVIYTGSQDCTIKVWETSQGKLIRELKGHGHWVNSLALSTEYVLRTGAFDHTGKQYSSPEEMKKVALERYNKMKGNAPERLVSGSDDFTMFLWEPFVSKHPKTRMTGHQQLVNHVYFSPDGQWVASASFDKSVKLWNGATGKFVAAFRGHVGPVYQISWSADSRLLLSGSKDSTLKVWDIRTQKLKQDLPGHEDEVYAVDWSPDGEKVASGGKDRVLKLWMG